MYIQCILKKKKAARRGKKEKTEKLLRKTIVLYHSHKSHQTYDSLCRKYSNICIPHKGLSQREKHYPSHLGFSYFFFQNLQRSGCAVAKVYPANTVSCYLCTTRLQPQYLSGYLLACPPLRHLKSDGSPRAVKGSLISI